jgi:hypothetical protein
MHLCFDGECEFFEHGELSGEVEFGAGTALHRGARFVEQRALHLGVATAIGFVKVIHFCNYN